VPKARTSEKSCSTHFVNKGKKKRKGRAMEAQPGRLRTRCCEVPRCEQLLAYTTLSTYSG
jgi:hypothetical protein